MKSEKQLYQWDVNQYLTGINPAAQYVDYPIGNEVIRLETAGARCRIPDEILQTCGGKTCYERYPDGTYRAYSFSVLYAPKPPDYVYTPEERTTFESLTARVDAVIEEIKRRADSGEFDGKTPVKGVDYYTKEEQAELITAVSSGAESEFRKVTEAETAKFEEVAESELTAYNRNAAEKLEAYNQNHTEKVSEYNANAETKTAEFDANAAALQTEVDRLRGECDQLTAENRKQENKISALIKLNKGQTYDILPEEGETASRTAPSGAKYVSVDRLGGKSIVQNQQVDTSKAVLTTKYGVTISRKENGKLFMSGTATGGTAWCIIGEASLVVGHKYLSSRVGENIPLRIERTSGSNITMIFNGGLEVQTLTEEAKSFVFAPVREGETANAEIDPFIIDLTLMFGAGNEPTAEQFEQMFPAESYQYNAGEIISSQTETITAGVETITAGFPELRSVGAVHDYIDMDDGEAHRNIGVIDLGTLDWEYNSDYGFMLSRVSGKKSGQGNLLCQRYNLDPNAVWMQGSDGVYGGNNQNNIVYIKDSKFTEPHAFKEAMKGVPLHFELEAQTTEPVTIPEALTEWLPVDPGGTVPFKNADESKQLAVPNGVSWVRKLDEVE